MIRIQLIYRHISTGAPLRFGTFNGVSRTRSIIEALLALDKKRREENSREVEVDLEWVHPAEKKSAMTYDSFVCLSQKNGGIWWDMMTEWTFTYEYHTAVRPEWTCCVPAYILYSFFRFICVHNTDDWLQQLGTIEVFAFVFGFHDQKQKRTPTFNLPGTVCCTNQYQSSVQRSWTVHGAELIGYGSGEQREVDRNRFLTRGIRNNLLMCTTPSVRN